MNSTYAQQWFGNIRGDLLSGTVVALALIPEAIAFSIIAGVAPQVGLYASFCIAVVIAFVGGRPGMISAATGAMALLMVSLVKEHGLQYLFAATLLTGILQILAGWLRLGDYMRFVARSVVIGFVNALAILIFLAQLPEFEGQGFLMYGCVGLGLGIIYGLPFLTKAVPSPLVCIITLTTLSLFFGWGELGLLRTVGDLGELPSSLPAFLWPDIPWTLDTLLILLPYSVPLALVGILESLMTATIVDDVTDSPSDKNTECKGQGLANIVAGCFGGMAGCAMIGQTVINVKSGGRGRLSSLWAGVFLLILVVGLGTWVARIPMAALVAVMIMVSIGTFSWASLRNIPTFPRSATIVTFGTVAVVVLTHNLALGVGVGVLLSALNFASKISVLTKVSPRLSPDGTIRTYFVSGQVFFASTTRFLESFNYREKISQVILDVSHAHFWDTTSINALDKVIAKFRTEGLQPKVIGLNAESEAIVRRLAIYDKSDIAPTNTVGQ